MRLHNDVMRLHNIVLGVALVCCATASFAQERLTVDDAVKLALKGNYRLLTVGKRALGSHDVALSQGARLLPAVRLSEEYQHWDCPFTIDLMSFTGQCQTNPMQKIVRASEHQQLRRRGQPAARRPFAHRVRLRRAARERQGERRRRQGDRGAGGADGADDLSAVLRGARARGDRRRVGRRAGGSGHGRAGAHQGRRHHQRRSSARDRWRRPTRASSRSPRTRKRSCRKANLLDTIGMRADANVELVEPTTLLTMAAAAAARRRRGDLGSGDEAPRDRSGEAELGRSGAHEDGALPVAPARGRRRGRLRPHRRPALRAAQSVVRRRARQLEHLGMGRQLLPGARSVAAGRGGRARARRSGAAAWRSKCRTTTEQTQAAAVVVDVAQQTIGSAKEAYRVTQALVQAGSATTTDLLDAQSAFLTARLNLARAQYEMAIQRVAFARAIGE